MEVGKDLVTYNQHDRYEEAGTQGRVDRSLPLGVVELEGSDEDERVGAAGAPEEGTSDTWDGTEDCAGLASVRVVEGASVCGGGVGVSSARTTRPCRRLRS
jgi:hypothetical protein